jgi:hypothetical protein
MTGGMEVESARQGFAPVCFGALNRDCGGDLDRRIGVRFVNRATKCPTRTGVCFADSFPSLVTKEGAEIGVVRRTARRKFSLSACESALRRSPGGGLPLFLRFAGNRCFQGSSGSG